MAYKLKSQISFHFSNTNNAKLLPNFRETTSKSIVQTKNLADLNADELFDNFDDLFEVKIKESFNPDTYRVDTNRTIIKDLNKKFNDVHYIEPSIKRQSPSEAYIPKKPIINENKIIKNNRFIPEPIQNRVFTKTQLINESQYNESKLSINANSFIKRFDDCSFETRNKSFHKSNLVKPKIPQKNNPYLITLENKENIPTNPQDFLQAEMKKKEYNHRRVETYCDIINSVDDENMRQISPFSRIKEGPRQMMNKSLIDAKGIFNERKKVKEINSYENVGRLLKLLKQDAEKRINSRRKADLSFTSSSFLKPQSSKVVVVKDKNLKRSISTGITRK